MLNKFQPEPRRLNTTGSIEEVSQKDSQELQKYGGFGCCFFLFWFGFALLGWLLLFCFVFCCFVVVLFRF